MEDWLAARARSTPHALALLSEGSHWDYRALDAMVEQFALALRHHAKPGQRVAALLPNNLDFVCLIHATARLGAVLVPLNVRLTVHELAWQIEHAGCSVIIATERTAGRLPENMDTLPPLLLSERLLNAPPASKNHDWPLFDQQRLQSIIFTSGTTGRPKGAALTFDNHFFGATASAFRLGVETADMWLCCLPLYHVGGMAIILRSCLYGTAVVLHEGFNLTAIQRDLIAQPISVLSLVPTMLRRLLHTDPPTHWPDTLRHVLVGGAAVPRELLATCRQLNIPVSVTYGLTEAASQVATMTASEVSQKPGSAGHPLLFCQVAIVEESGRELPPGAIGEIVVSGPTIMAGYYNDPIATEHALRDGWLHTGDVGYLDQDGDLWVVQRRDDIIISGGENIYPAEIEAVLSSHPGVDEVCVIGLDDDEWGQRIAAVIVPSSGASLEAAALQDFCRVRLAGYKIPRHFQFVDALPKTASGKIRRRSVIAHLPEDSAWTN